jgi:CubicO group peptidase (beta-lactamase class C family)
MYKSIAASIALLFLLVISETGIAQSLSTYWVDSLVERTLKTFDVPGIAVGIVRDGEVVLAKGYGVRSLSSDTKVDQYTLFGIASNSKAFTSAAIGMLVDEGKLDWDDKVIDYIPEFRMYDPYVTREFTIRDLLTHRSGLGLGAGDLMIFPDSADFTLQDIIQNLRYLKPVSSFRSKFDYDNLMYIVAGEIVARVSGMSWDEFIEGRIMKPLGMTSSAANYFRLKDKSNVIDPHAPLNGKVQVIGRDFSTTADAAGGIYSNIHDMCRWVNMQLSEGAFGYKQGQQLFSKETHLEMWTLQTSIPIHGPTPYNTHMGGYGLGWFLSDGKGFLQVSHTGGLAGIVTQVTLIPELKLGIIVLTNQQSGAAFTAITNSIKDFYYDMPAVDRVQQMYESERSNKSGANEITEAIWKEIESHSELTFPASTKDVFTGKFFDDWFGEVTIANHGKNLWFSSKRSPRLRGEMFFYKGNTFVVKWNDRSMDADAFVMFSLDENGKASGFTMKAISPMTDFSYDFQDLDFSWDK